jgi:ribosomal protein L29
MATKNELPQTAPALTALLTEQRAKLAQLTEDRNLGRLKDTSQIRQVRRAIARILTAMRNVK